MNFISYAKLGVHHKSYDHRPPGNMIKKLLLTMKLTAILLTVFCLQVSATTKAQQVTLTVKNAPLEKVIKQLHEQSGYSFLYNVSYLKESVPVTVNLVSVPIEQALKVIFKDQPFEYEIQEKTIILKERTPLSPIQPKAGRMIEGRVTDSAGTPMPGVLVRIEDTQLATATDAAGRFQFNNIPANSILIFSMVGYQQSKIPVGNKTEINVKLLLAVQSLNSVSIVSTGYQQLPKERATGSFDQISNAKFNERVSTDVISRLDGTASGVLIPNRNIPVGSNESSFTVRGRSTIFANTKPLVVIDNFPYVLMTESGSVLFRLRQICFIIYI